MKLIHIQQRHRLPSDKNLNSDIYDLTVRSQFEVAKIIMQYPQFPLVAEGLFEDFTNADSSPYAKTIKQIFPNGFPANFSDLTKLQQSKLYNDGAAILLFFLGKIPVIYKSMTEEFSKAVNKAYAEGKKDVALEPREKEAMVWIKNTEIKVFGDTKNGAILFPYGRLHSFKKLCDEAGYEYETIDTVSIALNKKITEFCERINKVINQLKKVLALQKQVSPNEEELNSESVLARIMIADIKDAIRFLNEFIQMSEEKSENEIIKNILSEYTKLLSEVQDNSKAMGVNKQSDTKNLLRFSILNSNPHPRLLLELESFCKSDKKYDSFIKAIKEQKYSLALRKASAVGSLSLVKILLKYEVMLNIKVNEPSDSNGWTALDWIQNAYDIEENIQLEIISCLLEHHATNGLKTIKI